MGERKLVLVTGATGYIGGRLVPRLLAEGYRVRVLARAPSKLQAVPWRDAVDVAAGDLADPQTAARACEGVDTLFYLVHSMGSGADFETRELEMAGTVADAAARSGVRRIVYLGGLHPDNVPLSRHMRSRTAVGRVLLEGVVPAVVFQAGVVIGSGSASFEMIRHLTENLPVMPAPSWVRRRIEPIAIRDVLHYLVRAPELPPGLNRAFDIGSREVLTYADLLYGYAHEAKLAPRRIYSLPVPAPRLAGWWVALTTPIPHAMAVPLVESLQHDAVSAEHDIDGYVPPPPGGLTGYLKAVELALGRIRSGDVETSWTNASGRPPSDPLPSDPDWAGRTVYVDERLRDSTVGPEYVWQVIEGIGGENGWYSWPAAWVIRGVLDKLVGGAGHNRGRRHGGRLGVGEAVDWWRVEHIGNGPGGKVLRLRAEMKVPGDAWLELSALPHGTGTTYRQRAVYFPRGLAGKAYWWLVLPFHGLIFPSMARNILRHAAGLEHASAGVEAAGMPGP
ncbi:SDR family oxidoreductase [Arthrobacter sp. GCM10027362]|uniref:SDR family oxidoreductase n=1 Tax=Arthrobacter sp. GCM10027362 TaxID=3273379 RepID=UPI003640B41D